MLLLTKVAKMVAEISQKSLDDLNIGLVELYELGKDVRLLGTMSEELKKLCAVMIRVGKDSEKAHTAWREEIKKFGGWEKVPSAKMQQIADEHLKVHVEEDFIKEAFKTCLKMEFAHLLTSSGRVHIVAGWQIAFTEEKFVVQKMLSDFVDYIYSPTHPSHN